MRWLLSLIFVMVTLSSAFATETKTEYITEEVCHAVAGCWVNVKTGECPDCVTETRKIVTVVEDWKFKEVESFAEEVVIVKKDVKKKSSEGCWFAEAGWPTGKLTDNFEPIMTGGFMPCDWRS